MRPSRPLGKIGGGLSKILIVDADPASAREIEQIVSRFELAWREVAGVLIPMVRKRAATDGGFAQPFDVAAVTSVCELDFALSCGLPDALIVDVNLGLGENGVQAVQRLVAPDSPVQVLFMVGPDDREALTRASGYAGILTKPVDADRLRAALQTAAQEFFLVNDRIQRTRPLCLKHAGTIYMVSPDEITYAESRGRTLSIYTKDEGAPPVGPIRVTMTLEHLRRLLPDSFVQCHKSFLVNLAQVSQLSDDTITLRGGSTVPVSQRRRAAVLQQLLGYGRCVAS